MFKYFSWSRNKWVSWVKETEQRERTWGSSLEVNGSPRPWAGLSAVTTCACGTMPREEIRRSFLQSCDYSFCAPPRSEANSSRSQGNLAGIDSHRRRDEISWAKVLVVGIKLLRLGCAENVTFLNFYY